MTQFPSFRQAADSTAGTDAPDAPAQAVAVEQVPPPPETAEEVVEDVVSTVEPVVDFLRTTWAHLAEVYLSFDGLLRVAIVIGTGVLAYFLSRPGKALIRNLWPGESLETKRGVKIVTRLIFPILWSIFLWIATAILNALGEPSDILRTVASLVNAWVVIRLFSSFVRNPVLSRSFAAFAWVVAALNILKLLNPTIALLDGLAINMGDTRLSLYMVIKGGVIALALLWGANLITSFVQGRLEKSRSLNPSMQTLVGQGVRLVLLFLALILALNVIGIDLTALAVFSGAIGIGIGFGLQAIFQNLMAGIILLAEGSVKVGDFVDLDNGLRGTVKAINIRSTRVTTNDNVDILVPNADFINNRVTNWTLRDGHRRVRIPFGVAYGTDKDLVVKAALEAAKSVDAHELKGIYARPAEVWLVNFGASSLDFELVLWLSPASAKRPAKVHADYTWALETALTKYSIEIPFPQRDLHIRSGELPLRMDQSA